MSESGWESVRERKEQCEEKTLFYKLSKIEKEISNVKRDKPAWITKILNPVLLFIINRIIGNKRLFLGD